MLTLILSLLAVQAHAFEPDRIVVCRSSEGSIPRDAELVYMDYARTHVQLPPEAVAATFRGVNQPMDPAPEMLGDGSMLFRPVGSRQMRYLVARNGAFTVERLTFAGPEVFANGRCESL